MFEASFRFKQFAVTDRRSGMKVGTDGVLAGALAFLDKPDGKVIDIGAGCGVIALMIAQRYPQSTVEAVEIDSGAAADLRENVAASPWTDRIRIIEDDYSRLEGTYDLIVSNPPYYNNGDISPDVARAMARHARSLSPIGLVDFASRCLSHLGRLSMIIPVEMAERVGEAAAFARLALSRRIDVSTSVRRGITRSFLEFSKDSRVIPVISRLDTNSAEYRELTREFYLNH